MIKLSDLLPHSHYYVMCPFHIAAFNREKLTFHDTQVVDGHVSLPDDLQEFIKFTNFVYIKLEFTWLPSFLPVFSAFWVTLWALKGNIDKM